MSFKVRLSDMRGCVLIENAVTVDVETVNEAREAILRYAMDALGHHAHDPKLREYLRLSTAATRISEAGIPIHLSGAPEL